MKKVFLVFAVLFTLTLVISGCSSSDNPPPIIPILSTFQNASVVIGQADFSHGSANQGGAAGANTLFDPMGKPAVYNGILYVSDSNNRVLGFNTVPTSNDASADFVLGQSDFSTTASGNAANKMAGPESIRVSDDGKLLVDDYGNNRVLLWNTAPTSSGVSADVVVGQTGFGLSASACTSTGLKYPESIETVGGKLIVADSGNNRVLIWNTIPTSDGAPADIVLGQGDFTHCQYNDDNQDGTHDANPTDRTLRYPTDAWSDGTRLIITDRNNSRVLIWNTFPTSNFTPADVVLGQGDFTHSQYNDDNQDGTSDANPTARTLSYPFNLDSNGIQLFVADSSNSRVLIWNTFPTSNFTPADVVLGQGDFIHGAYNDDNQDGTHDTNPTARTLYNPYGVYVLGTQLFITDEGNSRYLIFR